MKSVQKLYHQLQQSDFATAYPLYDPDDSKTRVLYVAPFLNGSGYYRMILPALELNRTDTHTALVTSMRKWDFSKSFDDLEHRIEPDLIRWADYIVFPAMYTNLQDDSVQPSFPESIKTLNPDVQLVIDLDTSFHHFPEQHPGYEKLNDAEHALGNIEQRQQALLQNISGMDVVTGVTDALLDDLDERLEASHPNADPRLEFWPNLLSPYGYEHLGELKKNKSPLVHIGLVGNYSTSYDLLTIREVLHELQQRFDDKIELFVFGWNGKQKNGEKAFGDLRFHSFRSVNFVDDTVKGRLKKGYFSTLYDLQLDIALLPMADLPYNTVGKSPVKYLELSAMQVPVVASDLPPYRETIVDGVTGYLASGPEEWVEKTARLIKDTRHRQEIGQRAFRHAWKHYSYNTNNLEVLQDIFL